MSPGPLMGKRKQSPAGEDHAPPESIASQPSDTPQEKPSRSHRLRPSHIIFAREYVRNGGNGTQAMLIAKPNLTYQSATETASQLLRTGKVQTEIDALLQKQNLGVQVRTETLSEILSQRYTEVEQFDGDGKLTARTRMANDKSRLAAIRELNKIDGTYARAQAIGHAQGKVIEPLLEEYSRRMRAELRKTGSETAQEGGPREDQITLPPITDSETQAEPTSASTEQAEQPSIGNEAEAGHDVEHE